MPSTADLANEGTHRHWKSVLLLLLFLSKGVLYRALHLACGCSGGPEMSREHILWEKVPLRNQQTCFQNCLELCNIVALTHCKWQVVSEERGSTGIRPLSKVCPKPGNGRGEIYW